MVKETWTKKDQIKVCIQKVANRFELYVTSLITSQAHRPEEVLQGGHTRGRHKGSGQLCLDQ